MVRARLAGRHAGRLAGYDPDDRGPRPVPRQAGPNDRPLGPVRQRSTADRLPQTHYRTSWWNGWAAALGFADRSAAWQEGEHLRWAAEHGFVVPRTVAVGEQVGPRGRLQSFIALEELT